MKCKDCGREFGSRQGLRVHKGLKHPPQVNEKVWKVVEGVRKENLNNNSDVINHPSHYTFGKYEVIDVAEDWFSGDPLLWQVLKYIARATRKGRELEDLKKARFYLDRRITKLEEQV